MLPRIIHMIYFPWGKDQRLLTDPHAFDHGPYVRMCSYAPDFEVRLWTLPDAQTHCTQHHPGIWELLLAVPRPMMMVDYLRWLVVHDFGGIYWQYDFNALANMNRMLPSSENEVRLFTEFVNDSETCQRMAKEPVRQGEPEESIRVVNQVFSARAGHPFIRSTMGLIEHRLRTCNFRKDYDLLFISANAAVSTAYDRFGKKDPTVELMPLQVTRQSFKIMYRGTWRTDSKSETRGQRSFPINKLRHVFKGIPGLQAAVHRWIKPHAHEEGLRVSGCRLQGDGSSFFVLRSSLMEVVGELGIRSVLECSVSGGSVFGGEEMTGVSLRVTTPVRRLLKSDSIYDAEESRSASGISFLNPMYSRLPRVDAILLVDYFDQIPNRDVRTIIDRAKKAGIRWLLASHYPCLNTNWDTYAGEWRPISLTLVPFALSEPVALIPDADPERRPDRALGVFAL
jgi:hypothetical protein